MQVEGWSDSQLAALQESWAGHKFLPGIENAFSMERAMTDFEFDRLRNTDINVATYLDGGSSAPATPVNFSMQWFFDVIGESPELMRKHIYSPLWKFAWSEQDQLRYDQKSQQA